MPAVPRRAASAPGRPEAGASLGQLLRAGQPVEGDPSRGEPRPCGLLGRSGRAQAGGRDRPGMLRAGQGRPESGLSRSKPRRRYDALTFPSYGDGCRLRENGRPYLRGIGDLEVELHRPVQGRAKTVSVKREAGTWHILFSCDVGAAPLPPSDEALGIDVGSTEACRDLLGLTISEGGIDLALRRLAERARPTYDVLGAEVRSSPVIGSDETAPKGRGGTPGTGCSRRPRPAITSSCPGGTPR